MAKFQYLSYFLDDKTLWWRFRNRYYKLNDISKGDTANTKRISFHNHLSIDI